MANVLNIQNYGNQLAVFMDDNTRVMCYPTTGGLWVAGNVIIEDGGGPTDPPPTDPGDGSWYDPWAGVALSNGGSWENHVTNTGRGGNDYPFAVGTPLPASAAGELHITGGSGEYAASTSIAGGAGRRSILYLDTPRPRVSAVGRNEAAGPLAALVYQHLSVQEPAGRIERGQSVGLTGRSGLGSETGYAAHLHIHGLDAAGARVDYLKFF